LKKKSPSLKKNSKANTKASCLNKKNEIKQPNTHPSQRTKTVESQKNPLLLHQQTKILAQQSWTPYPTPNKFLRSIY